MDIIIMYVVNIKDYFLSVWLMVMMVMGGGGD